MVFIGNSWDEILSEEFNKEYYLNIREILKKDYVQKTVFPPMDEIFSCLKYTAFEDVKVVILGQDPYHGKGQANGLAFSVKKGIKLPPSLRNIYKEIEDDIGIKMRYDGDLTYLAKQGVLLLNASLTVIESQPNSHSEIGWKNLTDSIIMHLNDKANPVCFLLWGKNAQMKKNLIKSPNHLILESPHPSPFSASRGFFGCRHFSKTNKFLKETGQKPINWQN